MIVLLGSRMFGQVEKVPGVGAISTEFFHMQYLPLVPLGSYFVSESPDLPPERIGLNWKSVFVAWARAWLIIGFVMFTILAALEFSEGATSNGITASVVGAAILCVFELLRSTPGIGRATKSRAEALRQSHSEAMSQRLSGWRSRAA